MNGMSTRVTSVKYFNILRGCSETKGEMVRNSGECVAFLPCRPQVH